MKSRLHFLAGLLLTLCLLCTACGSTDEPVSPVDDPNEGLGGGGLTEDTVNDFSGFEGIWLGEASNDYDSIEFDAEGNWTLYLSGEGVGGHLCLQQPGRFR